jgi:hypothetical protein
MVRVDEAHVHVMPMFFKLMFFKLKEILFDKMKNSNIPLVFVTATATEDMMRMFLQQRSHSRIKIHAIVFQLQFGCVGMQRHAKADSNFLCSVWHRLCKQCRGNHLGHGQQEMFVPIPSVLVKCPEHHVLMPFDETNAPNGVILRYPFLDMQRLLDQSNFFRTSLQERLHQSFHVLLTEDSKVNVAKLAAAPIDALHDKVVHEFAVLSESPRQAESRDSKGGGALGLGTAFAVTESHA